MNWLDQLKIAASYDANAAFDALDKGQMPVKNRPGPHNIVDGLARKKRETKTAAPRWQAALRAGDITFQDLSKIQQASGVADRTGMAAMLKGRSPSFSEIRQGLRSAATDLNPEQLARHRELQGRFADNLMRTEKAIPQNIAGLGAGTNLQGQVFMHPRTGTAMRGMVEGSLPSRARTEMAFKTPDMTNLKVEPKPLDKTLQNATMHHELTERAMLHAANSGQYIPRPYATHLGGAATVAEKHRLWRDPDASNVMDKLRNATPDDRIVAKRMTQYGATPNSPMPLGGRAHRKLEDTILKGDGFSLVTDNLRKTLNTQPRDNAVRAVGNFHSKVMDLADRVKGHVPQQYVQKVEDAKTRLTQAAHDWMQTPAFGDRGNMLGLFSNSGRRV